MSFMQEFKTFAMKGNVLDMAVGLIIGAAFNKIVTSLVNDVIMPPIGLAIGGVNFKELKYVLRDFVPATETSPELPAVGIGYGMFINTVLEFIIIAFTVFIIVRFMNTVILRREKQQA